mgnify:CR=1 FL=1
MDTDDVEFFPAQQQFLRGDKRYVGYISGVGAGKTFVGNWRTWLNMEHWNEGEMGAIVAPTRQMIINVILPEMRDMGFMDRWEHKSSHSDEPGLHSPNGSRALLLSADNKRTIERLRGLNLAWWHIDEKTAVPRRAQEILEQRLRVGEYRNGYITTTPKGKDDTYDFFVGNENAVKDGFGESTIYETDDKMAIVGVPTSANPHTPEDYKEAMEQDMPDEIRAQEVQGQFVELGGGVFTREMLQWIHPTDAPESNLKTIIGVDPASTADAQTAQEQDSDYWAVTVAMLDMAHNELLITDSTQRRGMTLKEGVSWLRAVAKSCEQSPQMLIESNQSQRWLQQELENQGLNAVPIQTTRNKEEKLVDLSIPLSNGVVKFVEWDNHPFQDLISQMLSWPDATHDDLMDSLSIIVEHTDLNPTSIISGSYRDE